MQRGQAKRWGSDGERQPSRTTERSATGQSCRCGDCRNCFNHDVGPSRVEWMVAFVDVALYWICKGTRHARLGWQPYTCSPGPRWPQYNHRGQLRHPGVKALPIPTTYSELATSSSCNDLHTCRTMWNIISSCIVTIFSCTWVAIHPNIPDLDEKWYKTLRRKLGIMLAALILPELIVLWSIQQWSVAGNLAEMYNADYNWTRTHGFFAAMGGFMVESDDGPLVLSPWELEPYLQSGQIEITEREIQDKSKGDILSKGLVVVQTGWFILQCLARAIEHLPITELELVTLAFATLNFAIYGFWWYKPLNVQCPCFVGKRSGPRSQPSENKKEDDSRQVGGIWKWLWTVFKPMNILFGITLRPGAKRVPIFYSGLNSDGAYWEVVAAIGTVFGAIHCVAWSFHFPSDTERLLWRALSLTITAIPSASLFIGVPVLMLLAICSCWAAECGGSSRESRVYKLLLGLWGPFITLTGPILYASARIGLLILSLMSLRSLTVDTYQTVHWTTFIPHV